MNQVRIISGEWQRDPEDFASLQLFEIDGRMQSIRVYDDWVDSRFGSGVGNDTNRYEARIQECASTLCAFIREQLNAGVIPNNIEIPMKTTGDGA